MTIEMPTRPEKVSLAIKLLYLVVGVGILRTVMTVMRHADVRSPHFLISIKVVLLAVSIFLIYQVGKGRNWARWSLMVILVINIPLTILPAFESYSIVPVYTLLGFLQIGLYIFALVLLFHAGSSKWFSMLKKASKSQ